MNTDFERLKTTDPIVKKVLAAGGSLEDVIVALVRHAEQLRGLIGDFEMTSAQLLKPPCSDVAEAPPIRHNRI